jgi:hypothetical protein
MLEVISRRSLSSKQRAPRVRSLSNQGRGRRGIPPRRRPHLVVEHLGRANDRLVSGLADGDTCQTVRELAEGPRRGLAGQGASACQVVIERCPAATKPRRLLRDGDATEIVLVGTCGRGRKRAAASRPARAVVRLHGRAREHRRHSSAAVLEAPNLAREIRWQKRAQLGGAFWGAPSRPKRMKRSARDAIPSGPGSSWSNHQIIA